MKCLVKVYEVHTQLIIVEGETIVEVLNNAVSGIGDEVGTSEYVEMADSIGVAAPALGQRLTDEDLEQLRIDNVYDADGDYFPGICSIEKIGG